MHDSSQPYRQENSRRRGTPRQETYVEIRPNVRGTVRPSAHSAIFVVPSPEYIDARSDAGNFAPYGPYEVRATNRIALACFAVTLFNLIFGTLSLITGPFFSLLVSLIGIVLGHIALHQLRRSEESGQLLARVSLVINYLALFGVAIVVIAIVTLTSFGRVLFGL